MGSFNISLKKQSVRKIIAAKRCALSKAEVEQKSLQISNNLIALDIFKLSRSIALFSPIHNEVRTQSVFDKAIEHRKEVYFPRVNGPSLDFCRVQNLEQLKSGNFGVLEPFPQLPAANIHDIDLFVLPGVAFDRSGNRVGYGKGFYDRALADVPKEKKAALAYHFQLSDSVPADEDDRKVGILITERGVFF